MATVRLRKGKWQVQVRLTGFKPVTATHPTRKQAVAWGIAKEKELLSGLKAHTEKDIRKVGAITLRDVAKAYVEAHTVTASQETSYNCLLADPLSDVPLLALSRKAVLEWRAGLLQRLKPETVKKRARMPRRLWEYARTVLEVPTLNDNPFNKLSLSGHQRHRRLFGGEYDALMAATDKIKVQGSIKPQDMRDIIEWAIETGMRRGEICRVATIHLKENTTLLWIPKTKTHRPREIPLTQKARRILTRRIQSGFKDKIFPYNPTLVTRYFIMTVRAAALEDLRFHDLRHEALSRLNGKGLTVFDMMAISGHKSPNQLSIYVQPNLEDIRQKMDATL